MLQNEVSEFEVYLNALNYYIAYAATPAPTDEFECTLLSVLGEYLYKLWDEKQPRNKKYKIPEQSIRLKTIVLKAISSTLRENREEFLPQETDEQSPDYEIRFQNFDSAIRSKIRNYLIGGLITELRWFFEQHGYSEDHRIHTRVKEFVDSRNALAHEHCFDSQRKGKPENIPNEILNIRGMIPLMFALIFGYTGEYWDVYTDSAEKIPERNP